MDKIVLISGGTGGIGREVAYLFSKEKNVLVLCGRDQQNAEEICGKCKSLGAKDAIFQNLDLENPEAISSLAEFMSRKFSKIDIVINSAGYLNSESLISQNDHEIDRVININFRGLVKLTKVCLPYIKESIVNVGSNLGLAGKRKLAVYSATKFAVRGFTKSLAQEMPNLRIYTVNPGLTSTKMGRFQGMPPEKVAWIIWMAAEGKYKAPSGSDINVNEYVYGERWKVLLAARRTLKRFFKISK